jgi:Trypsin
VLAGADATTATPICAGVVVDQSEDTTWVLTAAHCGSSYRDRGGQLFVRAACASERTSRVSSLEQHPLFRRGDPQSAYDFALLGVPRIPCALAAKLGALRPGAASVQVSAPHGWQSLRVASSTALRLQLHREDGALCQGSSGLPVFLEESSELEVVGLVSGGRADCRGVLQAGRVDALPAAFSSPQTRARDRAGEAAQTCAQCTEQLGLGAGPCGNVASHCARDPVCARAVTCLAACRSVDCERACLTRGGSSQLATLLRCSCAAGCSTACDAHCSP